MSDCHEEERCVSVGRIRHHRKRLRSPPPSMASSDDARNKFYENLHQLLATVAKADEFTVLGELDVDAPKVAILAPAEKSIRQEAGPARRAGDEDDL
nr:unnamed protein product [Spirometra erinaceieuropaei]